MIINDIFYLNSQALTLTSKNETIITNNYLWNYLYINKQTIYDCSRGSIQKAIDMDQFYKVIIKIPKNKQLISDLEPTFHEIERLQNEQSKNIKIVSQVKKIYFRRITSFSK